MEKRLQVGVFDSGMGGLSVLAECLRLFPEPIYYYYGDNARAPYGSRPKEEIANFTEEALRAFEGLGVDAAILACNTATAVCAEEMRKKFTFPIVGVEPAIKQAAKQCRRVLVLATPRTAESERLAALVARFPETAFTVFAAERLAAAIEEHLLGKKMLALQEHLPLRANYEGIVLGCTHYSLVKGEIASYFKAPVYDGAEGTAKRLKNLLFVGRSDHAYPAVTTLHFSEKTVIFLGKSRKTNEHVYNTNICFQCFRKKIPKE
ncbi:MAG: glutamate racemase [Clostridia bacterium]|nr:glutamate racemase [Clostridia bacterium]